MQSTKYKLGLSVALTALMTLPALAQDATLDEIIVTAQKREQNLQDVPISVATLDGLPRAFIFAVLVMWTLTLPLLSPSPSLSTTWFRKMCY